MNKYLLNAEMFRDLQEGLEDIKKLAQDPADEVARKRFEKKWENHSVREVLDLFMPAETND